MRKQVEEALSELVAAGQVISDSFAGLRAPLVRPRHHRRRPNGARLARAGRWSLANRKSAKSDHAQRIEQIARALLRRYGVVFMRCSSARLRGCRDGASCCACIAGLKPVAQGRTLRIRVLW